MLPNLGDAPTDQEKVTIPVFRFNRVHAAIFGASESGAKYLAGSLNLVLEILERYTYLFFMAIQLIWGYSGSCRPVQGQNDWLTWSMPLWHR